MISAFAVDPAVAAEWYPRRQLRWIRSEFGLGHPRVLFEYPKFSKWKKAVWEGLADSQLSDMDRARVEELLKWLAEARVRRPGVPYDSAHDWLTNAEVEWDRRMFGGILALENPRKHSAVITESQRHDGDGRWDKPRGATVVRTAAELIQCLSPLLEHAVELHVVDTYFDGHQRRFRDMLSRIARVMTDASDGEARTIIVHCGKVEASREHFELGMKRCETELPAGVTVLFRRWRQRQGGDRFHNRYILTEFGGVSLGIGVEAGEDGEFDDVHILTADQWKLRWSQYCLPGEEFEPVDSPDLGAITGAA